MLILYGLKWSHISACKDVAVCLSELWKTKECNYFRHPATGVTWIPVHVSKPAAECSLHHWTRRAAGPAERLLETDQLESDVSALYATRWPRIHTHTCRDWVFDHTDDCGRFNFQRWNEFEMGLVLIAVVSVLNDHLSFISLLYYYCESAWM